MKRILLTIGSIAAVAALVRYASRTSKRCPVRFDPLLALRGSGRGLWGNDAVEYVRRLRED